MNYLASSFGVGPQDFFPGFGLGFLLLVLWTIFWKGLALWHSAQRKQGWWFIILLVVNTMGILEIIYLFAVAKLTFTTLFPNKK